MAVQSLDVAVRLALFHQTGIRRLRRAAQGRATQGSL
jgi:hypothetical protein